MRHPLRAAVLSSEARAAERIQETHLMTFKPPGQCPACGEWVPRGAAACDDCGACAKSGWKKDAGIYDGLDLPGEDDDFDYDAFVAEEFGGKPAARRVTANPWWWVALVLLVVMVLCYVIMVS